MKTRVRGELPEVSAAAISKLGQALADGTVPPALLNGVIDSLGALRPEAVGYVDRRLVSLARLYPNYPKMAPLLDLRWFRPTDLELLKRNRRLAKIFMFHGSGHVRQAALDSLDEPPETSFFFAAIVWRLNDWVPEVRAAARRAADRIFPATNAEVIVGANAILLGRTFSWGRWGQDDQVVVDRILERADVVARLARRFEIEVVGPLGTQLKYTLRGAKLDSYLHALSRSARHPGVRAVALEALLRRRASWRSGFRKEWIDKRFGLTRRVPVYTERPLTERIPSHLLIMQGLADKSALVRLRAADAVIEQRQTFPGLIEVIERLGRDKARSIRERAAFLKRKLAEEHDKTGA
jgi:hypothetical protein